MKNFITNSNVENLRKRVSDLISASEELKFLVAFFYFSGLKELYNALIKNPDVIMKVLVGLNVDKFNYQLIEYADLDDQNGILSNDEIVTKFFDSIRKSINTEKFDNKEFYEQVKFFINLIKNNRLIIRKTVRPNHSKLYIFKIKDSIVKNKLFITGSSNLTSFGLATQDEFNVEISDYGVDDAEAYFDNFWESAIKITEDDYKERLIELLEKETLIKEISPFEAYALVLKIYLDTFEKKEIGESLEKKFKKNNYIPYKYQMDAVEQALSVIEKHNGVILADVVGLGKTVIACAIASELKKRGIIICPPGIMGDPRSKDSGWNMYKDQFGLYDWEVWSLGDLDKLQEYLRKNKDVEVIIIDEAHRFRNEDTKSYEYLKNICRNKIVILLTATPLNNRPADILSLLKLFTIPKKSSITLEDNLVSKFITFKNTFDRLAYIKKYYNSPDKQKINKAFNNYKTLFGEEFSPSQGLKKINQRAKYLAQQIRDVIEPVTIRRNRLDLQENPAYKGEIKNLSKVADPKELFFELDREQSEFYDTVIKKYFADPEDGGSFRGAIYRPFEYEIDKQKIKAEEKLTQKEIFEYHSQRNLYDFMRRLLVKRFESSFGAFEQSLKNFKDITASASEFVKKTGKYILDRDLLEKIYDKDVEEIEEYLAKYSEDIKKEIYPKNYKIYELEKFKYKEEFIRDIETDLELFNKVLNELKQLGLVNKDPKIQCVIEFMKKSLEDEPERKIVVFSEYIDTVEYLELHLDRAFKDRVLTITGNLTKNKLDAIYKNFDASFSNYENKYDILLCTDKLSEGFNLNRAGIVINYDIPWNPVRVIQRVGRINRIGKKVFDELYVINFFPTEKGAELVKSREIAANKMFLIHNTLGEDSKYFDIDEEPTSAKLYERINQNPEKLEEESFYTKVLKIYDEIKEKYPKVVSNLSKIPPRVKVAKKYDENEILVFIKKERLHIYHAQINEENKPDYSQVALEHILNKIECSFDEKALPLSDTFWDIYEEIKNPKERPFSLPEKSLEQQAINNLKTLRKINNDEIYKYKNFLEILLEDIIDYGTLPDYTLRRISNLEIKDAEKIKKTIQEIESLKEELGEDYLEKEKLRQKNLTKEIIVAIENRKL